MITCSCGQALLSGNADMSVKDPRGRTPTYLAAAHGNSYTLQSLLRAGAVILTSSACTQPLTLSILSFSRISMQPISTGGPQRMLLHIMEEQEHSRCHFNNTNEDFSKYHTVQSSLH